MVRGTPPCKLERKPTREAADKAKKEIKKLYKRGAAPLTPASSKPEHDPDPEVSAEEESDDDNYLSTDSLGDNENIVAAGSGGNASAGNEGNNMVDYDQDEGADPTDVFSKTSNIKVPFTRHNIKFFFINLENQLETTGTKSQWMKRAILQRCLPEDVVEELQDILAKGKTAAGATAYYDVKVRLIELYGQTPEDVYREAKGLELTGRPSQLATKLINKLCSKHPTLEDCCVEGVISGMWREKLPDVVRANVAHLSLGGGNLRNTLEVADRVYLSQLGGASANVAAVNKSDDEVAAFKARKASGGGGKKPKPGASKGAAGGSAKKSSSDKNRRGNIERSPDGPPDECCNTHYQYGKSAQFCRLPFTCPWKDILAPTPNKRECQLDEEENVVHNIETLIDIDIDPTLHKSEKIYADFLSNEFKEAQVEQVIWGPYTMKPQAQQIFEVQVKEAVGQVVAAAEAQNSDFRPRIKDLNSKKYFLIDTGACVSVYPKSFCPNAVLDDKKGLKAVNGSTLSTYGKINVKVRLDKKNYVQEMVVSNVTHPILGWNFLLSNKLDIIWSQNQCVLFNGKTKSSYPLYLGQVPSSDLNLAPINLAEKSYKEWANDHKSAPKSKSDHPDGPPPEGCCKMHKQFGKSAYFCKLPHSCPWEAFTTVPPPKNKKQ